MKVLVVTTARNSSGGARQALYLAQGLHARGLLIGFIAPVESSLRLLDAALPWVDLPGGLSALHRCVHAQTEPYFLSEKKIIVHAFHNKAVKYLALLGTYWKLRGLPLYCAAHRGVIFPPANPLPYILPGIDGFLVNSQACADTLPLYWRKNRAHVVPNCIPPARLVPVRSSQQVRSELGIAADLPVITCVTNNSANKGVDVLLKAFALLPDKNSRLVLVGVRREAWLDMCRSLGVEERVHLVPRTENVADYLQSSDIFVIPSLSESQPNVLLEAMSMGLPAAGSRVGGIPELIERPELLCTPGDEGQLAAALTLLLADPELRRAEGLRNKEKSAMFAPEYKLERTLALYESF